MESDAFSDWGRLEPIEFDSQESAMAYKIIEIDDGFMSVRISDRMRPADQEALQDSAKELIEKGKPVRLLAILDNFQGWERGEGWGDVGFLAEHGDDIVKMAIVGDERWKDEVFLFVGKGLRATEIEFFSPPSREAAELWVRT